jgi:hypothetical protein
MPVAVIGSHVTGRSLFLAQASYYSHRDRDRHHVMVRGGLRVGSRTEDVC